MHKGLSYYRLTLLAGKAAIEDDGYFSECVGKIIENRKYLVGELEKRGFYVLPSGANFVFAKTEKLGGQALYLALKNKGVLVRHFDAERINEFVRITVGTREQINILIGKIDEIIGKE